MHILKSREELTEWRNSVGDKRISFVPTMGALHDGHVSLVVAAKQIGDLSMVSIFVNPMQFEPNEDFKSYPRNIQKDVDLLSSHNVDVIYIPSVYDIYKTDHNTTISPPNNIQSILCGTFRPNHFTGVLSVCYRLFVQIRPDFVCLGMKDYQQIVVIEKMIQDFDMPIVIIKCPTLRDSNGLALSSRNQYLSKEMHSKASTIFQILCKIKLEIQKYPENHLTILNNYKEFISNAGFDIQYFEIRKDDLTIPSEIEITSSRIFIALYLNGVRLIDNLSLKD